MSDIAKMVSDTTDKLIGMADKALEDSIRGKGEGCAIGFEGTAFYLPLAYAILGLEVKDLKDARAVVALAKQISVNKTLPNGLVIPYLDGLLSKGLATLLVEELLACLTIVAQEGYLGFVPDTVLRSLGVQLVDGRIAGIAVIIGKAKDSATAVQIIRGFQEKNIVSLLVGNQGSINIKDQLVEAGVELGLDNYIVPLGSGELSSIFAVNFGIRAALTFGGCKGGQAKEIFSYTQNRVPAFVLVLGKLDEVIVTTGLGVLNLGFPIITDMDVPQVGKIETTKYEALVTEKDASKIVSRCVETRGIKIKVTHLPIPVLYSPAFEGERVRKENLKVEFGGKYSTAFEFLCSRPMDKVQDGKIELIGPDISETGNKAMPLGILVEVSARNFNKDFEPILERQIHRYLNEAQGVMHMGQREMIWVRISQEAFAKGLRLKHLGTIIHAMLHRDFGAIVDKAQVTLFTKVEDVEKHIKEALVSFDARDERLKGMVDENVDTFYSCALCQSFAPNHLCIITPERLGLCGAYSWLDAKAAYEITPSGGNQPIKKGECIEQATGQWKNINDFIFEKSNKTISEVSMYSLLVSPQSSCGCFECIVAVIPEVNGVMVVNRDHSGMTPLGMTFTQLAGSVGGGVQTPGFIGVGKLYISSKKFISAEGGLPRIVWMPKDLKEALKSRIEERAKELGLVDFYDKIADETNATTVEELTAFLEKKAHPALKMPALI
jgi:acetyl-CoA synthase